MDADTGLRARRRAQTRREIAVAASAMFAERGVAQVTAADIAESAGVSLRTFYRYFDTKEQAVAPVLEIGAARWQSALAAVPGEAHAAIASAIADVLSADAPGAEQGLLAVRPLLRALADDPDLRGVWLGVNHESEQRIRAIIDAHGGWASDGFSARLLSVAATDAIRLGLEEWAASDAGASGAGSPAELALRAFDALSPQHPDQPVITARTLEA